jgi:hypothetical protein
MDNLISRNEQLITVVLPLLENNFNDVQSIFWILALVSIEEDNSSEFSIDEIIDILKYSVKLNSEDITAEELVNADALLLSYAAYIVYQLPDFDETSGYSLVKGATNDET